MEISLDGGNEWSDLINDIIKGGYNGLLSSNFNNPLGGRFAWTAGKLGFMSQVIINLTPYAGPDRLIRFRMGTDSSLAEEGWYIDDIMLELQESCDNATFPLPPILLTPHKSAIDVIFEQPFMLDWTDVAATDGYGVFLGIETDQVSEFKQVPVSSTILDATILKAGTRYTWRVDSLFGIFRSGSSVETFRTFSISSGQLADHVLGIPPGLTQSELDASDYDNSGGIEVNDVVTNVNRQE
jgi:hypothetical protein